MAAVTGLRFVVRVFHNSPFFCSCAVSLLRLL
ncbi:Uncharacterised protein [Vibrio cholerae]|nr:Uncharacterised protein [Vibrio cholerae]